MTASQRQEERPADHYEGDSLLGKGGMSLACIDLCKPPLVYEPYNINTTRDLGAYEMLAPRSISGRALNIYIPLYASTMCVNSHRKAMVMSNFIYTRRGIL